MHWRIKGTVQKILGVHPRGAALHYRLQRRFGGLRDFRGEFATKMDDWRLMAGHLRNAGRAMQGARLMEIGSGWYPTFPLACYLCGAQRVHTFDLTRHFRHELLRQCVVEMGSFLDLLASATDCPRQEIDARYASLYAALDQGLDVEAATAGTIRRCRTPSRSVPATLARHGAAAPCRARHGRSSPAPAGRHSPARASPAATHGWHRPREC